VACFLNGVIEIAGAFIAETVRRVTPRAALLSALAGIAITFISMDFTFKIFARPLVALLPMAIIFVAYFSHQRLPLGLPGGMVAIAVGTFLGWALGTMNRNAILVSYALAVPKYSGDSLWQAITDPAFLSYFSVIFPMGIFNVVGSLQNIESAEAAGDRFRTFPSLMANGIGSVVAALFGSVFPTTIYIGHPGWKRLGARSGYFRFEWNFYQPSLFDGNDSDGARCYPARGGDRHSPLYRDHHCRSVISGDAQRTCAGGRSWHRPGPGWMGIVDG
jgi:AGZA family xanthine/uracil permease-like MFS transporter